MLALACALVGSPGYLSRVDIDANESVGDLKNAIKSKAEERSCSAHRLQLFLAKRGDEWLTYNEVEDSTDTRSLTELSVPVSMLDEVGLASEDIRHQLDLKQLAAG